MLRVKRRRLVSVEVRYLQRTEWNKAARQVLRGNEVWCKSTIRETASGTALKVSVFQWFPGSQRNWARRRRAGHHQQDHRRALIIIHGVSQLRSFAEHQDAPVKYDWPPCDAKKEKMRGNAEVAVRKFIKAAKKMLNNNMWMGRGSVPHSPVMNGAL